MKRILTILMLFSGVAVHAQTGNVNMKVETQDAYYPGGQEAFDKYVFEHLTYSEEAKSARVEGQIMVSFYVGQDSSLSGIRVINDTGYGVGERLKEVLQTMKFVPALANGTVLRSKVMMYVPVRAH